VRTLHELREEIHTLSGGDLVSTINAQAAQIAERDVQIEALTTEVSCLKSERENMEAEAQLFAEMKAREIEALRAALMLAANRLGLVALSAQEGTTKRDVVDGWVNKAREAAFVVNIDAAMAAKEPR
jgi:vacuolar-type H+-ATPase subunit I/STV1